MYFMFYPTPNPYYDTVLDIIRLYQGADLFFLL